MTEPKTARVLIVAGSDSGGGAGIQADIKTVTMLGGHAMTAITAITAQNTLGVQAVMPVPAELVVAQMRSCIDDIGVDAVKIGMIGSAQTAHAVADVLDTLDVPIVFDPVMAATSGAALADDQTVAAFGRLMDLASLVTPNLPELAALGGRAAVLAHGCHLLEKGGHADGAVVTDRLFTPSGHELGRIEGKRFATDDTHGTGCTLASVIACRLGQGYDINQAFEDGVRFTRIAMLSAPGFGGGHGPLGHAEVRDFWEDDIVAPGIALNQVTVGADDYAASVAFYRTLGLRQIVDSPDNGYARFEAANGATFSIHAGAGTGGATVYFESPRLDGWVRELIAAGLTFDQLPRDEDWLWREARLRDPAGNVLCLYHAGDNRRYPPWRLTGRSDA